MFRSKVRLRINQTAIVVEDEFEFEGEQPLGRLFPLLLLCTVFIVIIIVSIDFFFFFFFFVQALSEVERECQKLRKKLQYEVGIDKNGLNEFLVFIQKRYTKKLKRTVL